MASTKFWLHKIMLAHQLKKGLSYLALALFVLLANTATAQNTKINVSGVVKDVKGITLPGVNILVKGTKNSAVSDFDGKFTISVPNEQSILVFTFVGFQTKESTVSNVDGKTVTLSDASSELHEVVVVGYGSQRKKMVTTAVASISASQIKDLPVANLGTALQGQMAGVNVTSTNGSPGQPPVIRVRGTGSISAGNSPLYVIDGYPMETAEAFNMISPNDIESVQVLKDAAAAAIYGSRGGNGVIIVTTKRGGKGKTRISFNSFVGVQSLSKKIDVLNTPQFLSYLKDVYVSQGLAVPANVANPPANLPDTDWQDEIYHDALQKSYNLSASGGSETVNYSISGGYLSQEGIVDLTKFTRFNVRMSLDAQISKKLKVGGTFMPSYAITDNKSTQGIINGGAPESGGGIAVGGVVHTGVAMQPFYPVRYANGDYAQPGVDPTYNGANSMASGNMVNPVALLNLYEDQVKTPLFLGSVYLDYAIIPNLKFKSFFGTQYSSSARNVYTPATLGRANAFSNPIGGTPGASLSQPNLAAIAAQRIVGLNYNWISENYLSYDKTFGTDHTFSALVGYSAQQDVRTVEALSGQANTFFNDVVHTVANAAQINGSTGYGENTITSVYGRVNYGYKDKYLLGAAIRRDGSSRFGSDSKYANFPSASAAWRIKQEKFMDKLEAVSELKIRATYGVTGNNNFGNYASQSYLASVNYAFGAGNGTRNFGYLPGGVSNPNLTWETNYQTDLGLELGLFQDRIYFTADVYKRNTKDLLLGRSIPATVGFANSVLENIGEVENKGLELGLTSRNFVGKFKWTTNANISFNKNEVVKLANANFIALSGGVTGTEVRLSPGEALGTFYGYKQIGVYQTQAEIDATPWTAQALKPGDIKYADINGDNKVDANDITKLGSPQPKYTWGLTNTFAYNNFDLNIIIRGAQGGLVLYANDRLPNFFPGAVNARTNVLDRWKSPQEPGNGMEPTPSGRATRNVFSDRYLFDSSFLQIANITLGYTVPKNIFRSESSSLRFYASVQNLHTFTKYVGYNPEANNGNEGGSAVLGVDNGSYPLASTYVFGLNFNF